jgi:hypothetical protein
VWPSNKEIADVIASSRSRDQFLKRYGEVTKGRSSGSRSRSMPTATRIAGPDEASAVRRGDADLRRGILQYVLRGMAKAA